MLTMVARLLKILNSESEPSQISLAFCLSMVAGLTPFFGPLTLAVLLTVLVVRVNLSAFILGMMLFSGVAFLLDPLLHRIGLAVLSLASLNSLWTAMYNTTFWRIARFNNSVVMGGFLVSLLCFLPLLLLCNLAIRRYREHVLAWVRKSRIMQMLMANRLYDIYQKVSGWGG